MEVVNFEEFFDILKERHPEWSPKKILSTMENIMQRALNAILEDEGTSDKLRLNYVDNMRKFNDFTNSKVSVDFTDNERLEKALTYFEKVANSVDFEKHLPKYQLLKEEVWAFVLDE